MKKLAISWIGAGKMGLPVCKRLKAAGHHVRVLARSPERTARLSALGLDTGANTAELVAQADVVFTCVSDDTVTSNHPERYVDQIFEEVLKTFSRPDTLTRSLQDWRKGRRAEVQDVNGWVVDSLRNHGRAAPMNQRVVELALQIESGKREAKPENAQPMIETYEKFADSR